MNEKTKESKFLDAINRYAEGQKAAINQEIEDYKNKRIEQATEQGLQDAYELIRSDIARRKSEIVNATARRELDLRRELFCERQRIFDEVFAQARERLCDFRQSDDYGVFLSRCAQETAALFSGRPCTVALAPSDEQYRTRIAQQLPAAVFETDSTITLGGMRAYCKELGLTADNTLDSRLADQREWFIEHSGLKVV